MEPDEFGEFGVNVVSGVPYAARSKTEIMLGYRAAADLGKKVGDDFAIGDTTYRVVGIFSTGQVFGDSAAMLPLSTLQAEERKAGSMTLIFVRTKAGVDIDQLRARLDSESPQLATVRTQSDFGRVDRNLVLINAANLGGSILALTVGAIGVMNTTLLSFFERIREFGVLRAVGWTRRRVLALVLGEAFVVSLAGAMVGVALGLGAIKLLEQVPDLAGVFRPVLSAAVFWRALGGRRRVANRPPESAHKTNGTSSATRSRAKKCSCHPGSSCRPCSTWSRAASIWVRPGRTSRHKRNRDCRLPGLRSGGGRESNVSPSAAAR